MTRLWWKFPVMAEVRGACMTAKLVDGGISKGVSSNPARRPATTNGGDWGGQTGGGAETNER